MRLATACSVMAQSLLSGEVQPAPTMARVVHFSGLSMARNLAQMCETCIDVQMVILS